MYIYINTHHHLYLVALINVCISLVCLTRSTLQCMSPGINLCLWVIMMRFTTYPDDEILNIGSDLMQRPKRTHHCTHFDRPLVVRPFATFHFLSILRNQNINISVFVQHLCDVSLLLFVIRVFIRV